MSDTSETPDEFSALRDELAALRLENASLKRRLGEGAPKPARSSSTAGVAAEARPLQGGATSEEKISLFRHLFRGRTDIYPLRWENAAGKSGYAPACANEWRAGVCEKPRIKCAECPNRAFLPVTDDLIRQHLTGKLTAGVYPLLPDDSCHFLAMDFDGEDWQADALSVRESCQSFQVPAALEISRSGDGAHLWIFFDRAVPAREARALGTALISHTCARRRVLQLTSYDRLFPNQDRLPKGGFGNLIALPLQRVPRESARSVFVDDSLTPWPDQWTFLAGLPRMPSEQIEPVLRAATGGAHPLDVAFILEEDEAEPWKPRPPPKLTPADRPERLQAVLANAVYFEKEGMPPALANRLIRLAAFQNPDFYRAQAMRRTVWNIPRVIGCATSHPRHLALPRGCLDAAQAFCRKEGIALVCTDERATGEALDVQFRGALRPDQTAAVTGLLAHDTGMLVAPTGFGKTVIGAAVIARRGVSTLVLVHRQELQRQWIERLQSFLEGPDAMVGSLGGGKSRLNGRLDVAVLQSVVRAGEDTQILQRYGQVIVDECHHIPAESFEAVLRAVPARYVLGLTATPIRRDGLAPILAMQCGPVRHVAGASADAPHEKRVYRHLLPTRVALDEHTPIQEVLSVITQDLARNASIVADVAAAYRAGGRVLLLTERKQHVETLASMLTDLVEHLVVLHGRLASRERIRRIAALAAMAPEAPRVVLATGKLIGEGFDHAPLDTLFLAMPISWKGTLQQYAGRLSRAQASKTRVVIHDYVDADIAVLARMARRRALGYKAIGYQFAPEPPPLAQVDFLQSGESATTASSRAPGEA
jgi:superfamily II DNA or RNA helicase